MSTNSTMDSQGCSGREQSESADAVQTEPRERIGCIPPFRQLATDGRPIADMLGESQIETVDDLLGVVEYESTGFEIASQCRPEILIDSSGRIVSVQQKEEVE